jgi:hypothetical protein
MLIVVLCVPLKKSRRIGIDATLEVVADLRLTSTTGRRVVIIYDADRFATEAANSFFKNLRRASRGHINYSSNHSLLSCIAHSYQSNIEISF